MVVQKVCITVQLDQLLLIDMATPVLLCNAQIALDAVLRECWVTHNCEGAWPGQWMLRDSPSCFTCGASEFGSVVCQRRRAR